LEWLCRQLGWPFQAPRTIADLVHLEAVFDVLDLYLWLRFACSSQQLIDTSISVMSSINLCTLFVERGALLFSYLAVRKIYRLK